MRYQSRYADPVVEVLHEHGVQQEQMDAVADTLAEWIDHQPSTECVFLVLASLGEPPVGDHAFGLTPHQMAMEIREHTVRGASFVEAFVAGALTNKEVDLNESLEILRSES